MKFCFAIMISHVSHCSYPSRWRACFYFISSFHRPWQLMTSKSTSQTLFEAHNFNRWAAKNPDQLLFDKNLIKLASLFSLELFVRNGRLNSTRKEKSVIKLHWSNIILCIDNVKYSFVWIYSSNFISRHKYLASLL